MCAGKFVLDMCVQVCIVEVVSVFTCMFVYV